jgi:hypothetical protein
MTLNFVPDRKFSNFAQNLRHDEKSSIGRTPNAFGLRFRFPRQDSTRFDVGSSFRKTDPIPAKPSTFPASQFSTPSVGSRFGETNRSPLETSSFKPAFFERFAGRAQASCLLGRVSI